MPHLALFARELRRLSDNVQHELMAIVRSELREAFSETLRPSDTPFNSSYKSGFSGQAWHPDTFQARVDTTAAELWVPTTFLHEFDDFRPNEFDSSLSGGAPRSPFRIQATSSLRDEREVPPPREKQILQPLANQTKRCAFGATLDSTAPCTAAPDVKKVRRESKLRNRLTISRRRSLIENPLMYMLVTSDHFDYIMGVILIMNAVQIGIQVDWQSGHIGKEDPSFFSWADRFFCVVFAAELAVRIYVFGRRFYIMPGKFWNFFDTLFVIMQVMEEVFALVSESTKAKVPVFGVGILKLLKLGRLLRMVRLLHLIPELKSMVYLILASTVSFFWTCGLLLLLIYVVAVYFVMTATDSLTKGSGTSAIRDQVAASWGGLGPAIMSLFQSISGGVDWGNVIGPLVELSNNQCHSLIFTCYIAFASMVFLNLVTGVFVEGAQRLNAEDRDKELAKMAYRTFDCVDDNDDVTVTLEELEDHCASGTMDDYLKAVDLSRGNATDLFKLLDMDSDGALTVKEFVNGCMRLKGMPRAADVSQCLLEMKAFHTEFAKFSDEIFVQVKKSHALMTPQAFAPVRCGSAEKKGVGPHFAWRCAALGAWEV